MRLYIWIWLQINESTMCSQFFSAKSLRLRIWIWLPINMLAIYSKSFSAGPDMVLSVDLTINLKSSITSLTLDNRIYLCITTGVGHHQKEASV